MGLNSRHGRSLGPAPDGDMRRTAAKTAGGAEVLEMKGPGPFPIGEGPAKLRDHILPSLKGLPGESGRRLGEAEHSHPQPPHPQPRRLASRLWAGSRLQRGRRRCAERDMIPALGGVPGHRAAGVKTKFVSLAENLKAVKFRRIAFA